MNIYTKLVGLCLTLLVGNIAARQYEYIESYLKNTPIREQCQSKGIFDFFLKRTEDCSFINDLMRQAVMQWMSDKDFVDTVMDAKLDEKIIELIQNIV